MQAQASVRSYPALALFAALSVAAACAHAGPLPPVSEAIMRPTFELQLREHSLAAELALHPNWTYVGHAHANHAGAANPWNVYTGSWDPGAGTATSAQWDFDSQVGLGAGDSLQGWWPVRLPYRYVPMQTMTDDMRPWGALDHGNQLSYSPVNRGRAARTFGVVSAWHADPGNRAGGVPWSPLSGAQSMWCGLRALGDMAVADPVTGQPYNEAAVQYNTWAPATTAEGTLRNYPGYGNQWDQMLYRDVAVADGAPLALSFLYRTRLSTAVPLEGPERTGWFHGDPLSMQAGNFISASAAGANAPRDSFTVYVGVPVNDGSCVYTDPTISPAPVYDRQRRWFDEVLRRDARWYEVLGVAGAHPAEWYGAPESFAATIPWADPGNGWACVSALYNAPGNAAHLVRVVFRVKTNVAYSDDDTGPGDGAVGGGFTSAGWGAALLDDVTVNGTRYDFEQANGGVDNAVDAAGNWATPPTACWKTTGKPLTPYVNPGYVDAVTWNDVCGMPGSPTSTCHVGGIVASIGNADQSGAIADQRWATLTEVACGMVSPTVNLVTPVDGTPNAMGITRAMTACSEDLYLIYELNFSAFNLNQSGALWNVGCQAYPAKAANGHDTWSDIVVTPFRYYQSNYGCLPDLVPLKSNGMLRTSKGDGVPDSVRVYIGITSECFYFGGTCNTTLGGCFDNLAVVLANRPDGEPVGTLRSDLWQWFNDAFPVNGYEADNVAPGSDAFDTTTALVKGVVNLAPPTGDLSRCDVLADSIVVCAPNATGADRAVRVDLVFRILPGPGNYQAVGWRMSPPMASMQLLRVPTDQTGVVSAGDGSFWGEYIANPGAFASPGAHAGGKWDHLAWNSARCDTLEANLFPVVGRAGGVDPEGTFYQSTYHESDPHYERLGILKGRCFLIDPTGPANSTNISCDPAWNAASLAWPLAAGTGFDGAWTTKECTKIIPDGLLTPGSHVQYFFRKQLADGTGGFVMDPDTTTISPQLAEGGFDGHRWQQFGVLPDRWKDSHFSGPGMACMLVIDNDDRRGDERAWVSVADSTCWRTEPARWGAHNGWHAKGAGFGLDARTNPNLAQAFVRKNSQPGTVWDLYGVKASEAGPTGGTRIGSRYAPQPTGLMAGKGAAIGPRKSWLQTWYQEAMWLTGDLNSWNIGPVANIGEDDVGVFESFLADSQGRARPRGILVQGDGFAEQCNANGGTQLDFLNNYLFCGLRDASYTDLTPSLVSCPDLISDASITPSGDVYGVRNDCLASNDVLDPGVTEAMVSASYPPIGVNAPYRAGIEHAPTAAHNWLSVINGWDMVNTFSRGCATSYGRLGYYNNLLSHVFGSMCGSWGCFGTLSDEPSDPRFANSLSVGNSVVRSGEAVVHYGAAKAGRVRIRLYDVAGRLVRTLADRTVAPGAYDARWDGRDDAGRAAPRGVYFARIDYEDGGRIAGRIVFLK